MLVNVKKILSIGLLVLLPLCAAAEPTLDRDKWKHELRLGWGDQLFETLMWHNPAGYVHTMPASWTKTYQENYHYDQHLWFEYQYRFNKWFGLGGMLDLSEVHWDNVTRNGQGQEVNREPGHYFYNAVIMPTVRFTYFHHEYVNLYSGLGIGMGINGGSETNAKGKKDVVGFALDLTVIGLSVNYKQWFMTVDLGGMYSLQNTNVIFLAGSRMISVGMGARF